MLCGLKFQNRLFLMHHLVNVPLLEAEELKASRRVVLTLGMFEQYFLLLKKKAAYRSVRTLTSHLLTLQLPLLIRKLGHQES